MRRKSSSSIALLGATALATVGVVATFAVVLRRAPRADLGGEGTTAASATNAQREAEVEPARTERPKAAELPAFVEAKAGDVISSPEEIRLRLVAQARVDLQKLEIQRPEGFLTGLVRDKADSVLAQAVYAKAQRYFAARTDAIRAMTNAYIANVGDYDFRADLDQLDEIDAAYRRSVAELKARVPQIEQVADIMRKTALRVPTFAQADDDARRERPHVVVDMRAANGEAPPEAELAPTGSPAGLEEGAPRSARP